MNIADQVKQDVLSENYITQLLQHELEKAKEQNLVSLKNDILLRELKKFKNDTESLLLCNLLDESIKLKYNQVSEYMSKSSLLAATIHDTIKSVEKRKLDLPKKRMILGQKVAEHVKTVLQVSDVTWSIIEEFKYKKEKDKNIQLDEHYTALVDTLLLKVKILHITVLIATYEDKDFTYALESLKNLLERRYIDAQTTLEYTTQQLKEYNDIGPEFKTLSEAYYNLLARIQATKDDINRIKNNH